MTPHNIEAEQAVLGALLLDNDSIDRAGDIRVEHFYNGDNRAIYAEIRRQIASGKAADVISVFEAMRERLQDGLSYLNSLAQNTPSSANIGRYAEIVRDSALRRGLIAETSRIADLAVNPGVKSASEVLDAAQSAISTLAETRVKREPIRASDALIAHTDIMQGRMDRKIFGIPTGFAEIDKRLNGGMNRGNLVIVAGRPSMGKTALAGNIATNGARDYGALMCSQEMSISELTDRNIASVGSIYLSSIITGVMDDEDWNRFTSAAAKIKEMNLHLDDQPALTLFDVRSKATLIKRKSGLDLLIVDYLQLMSGEGDNRNNQIEEISRGLKALAKELNIVVIALSQLNRQAATRRPQMSDLRDSGAIEQDADIVMFVHRDEVNNPDTHMRGLAEIIIAKNRQGAIGDVLLGYEGCYTRFVDHIGSRPEAPKYTTRRNGLAEHL